jgi:molybdopterin molybdotransferase
VSEHFSQRIGFDEAVAIVDAVAARSRLDPERVPLARALQRVLSDDVIADLDLPSFTNSAMDGFAFRADGSSPGSRVSMRLVGEQFAGLPQELAIAAGQCVRITTGAPMPHGADTVVIKEDTLVDGDAVTFPSGIRAGQHVRAAGEDVRRGDTVLRAGQALLPARISLAAALGRHDLSVSRRPTVAVFTTGDELVPPGQSLAAGQIYDSNRALLQTLLIADGYEPVAWPVLPDDPQRMLSALRDAAFSFDLVLTCGGVSAGEKDHLPALLREHGDIHFWKVRMRPGMPVLFGRLDGAHFIGLPGNPVSVFATYLTLARRLLDGVQGRAEPRPRVHARLDHAVRKTHPRLEFLRGLLYCDDQGLLRVSPNPADGSHRLRAAADSNALIVLPETAGDWPAGHVVQVLPLSPA